jgi:hypothetical protein
MLRSPLLAAGALLNVLTIPPLLWLGRVAPQGATCQPAPTEQRLAWTAGLAPIAFGVGCATVLVLLWASSLGGVRRPRTADLAGATLALALGLQWWAGGEASLGSSAAVLSIFAIYPVGAVAAGFYGWLLWAVAKDRPLLAWQLVRALCWSAIVVGIPFFVALISEWGSGGLCMSATAFPVL